MKKKLITGILASTLLVTTACSAAWLSTFEGYLKVAGPVLIQILDLAALLKGGSVNPALVTKINNDQVAAEALVQSIETASAQQLPNTCAAANAAIQTFAGDLGQIESLFNVGPGTSGEIGAAVGIAQAAIQEIETPIQACQTAPTPAGALAVLSTAHVKSPDDFVKQFNKAVDKKHQVHLRGRFSRIVHLGHEV